MQEFSSKEVIVFLIAANIIVAGLAVFFFLSVRIQQKRKQVYQRELLEKELKSKEEVIQQISRDLHDEIGSSLSGINMLTQLVLNKIEGSDETENQAILARINAYSNEVIDKVNDMAWLLKPGEESLNIMLSKLKKFGTETSLAKNIVFEFHAVNTKSLPKLSLHERKAIYLISKEAINNAVKYAECRRIDYQLESDQNQLNCKITDNGKGFDQTNAHLGNGLENMKQRAYDIGADFKINTSLGNGTLLEIHLNLLGR